MVYYRTEVAVESVWLLHAMYLVQNAPCPYASRYTRTRKKATNGDTFFADHVLVRADRYHTELTKVELNKTLSTSPVCRREKVTLQTRQKRGLAFTRTCVPAAILVVVIEKQGDCDSRPCTSSTR